MSVFKKIATAVGHVALNVAIVTTAVVSASLIVQKINEKNGG